MFHQEASVETIKLRECSLSFDVTKNMCTNMLLVSLPALYEVRKIICKAKTFSKKNKFFSLFIRIKSTSGELIWIHTESFLGLCKHNLYFVYCFNVSSFFTDHIWGITGNSYIFKWEE